MKITVSTAFLVSALPFATFAVKGTWVVENGIRKFQVGRAPDDAKAEAAAAYSREPSDRVIKIEPTVSLDEVNAMDVPPGAKVLFRRGGVWRGQLQPRSGRPGFPVTYGAFGEGEKPVIQPSYDKGRESDWTLAADGVWHTVTGAAADIGNIVLDHGANGACFKRGGFAAQGLKPSRIWIIGASAGGHLALWTGLNMKTEQVAGIISVSGIADPLPDARANPARYVRLFGGREPTTADFDAMSIMKLVRKNGPRILLTHAKEDSVVPFESAAKFCNAYKNAGNNIFFYQYSAKDEANTGGHAIWRKDYPVRKRLLKCIEYKVAHFMGLVL